MSENVMTTEDQDRIGLLAGQAFSPGAPIQAKDVFAGRKRQIRQAIDTIHQDGRSILIYGERGVGKTSLANVIDDFFLSIANARIFAPHIACDTTDDFTTIWDKVFKERDRAKPTAALPAPAQNEIDTELDRAGSALSPYTIKSIADVITRTHVMIPIIDEFDRIQDRHTLSLFTDAIKYLSDHTRNTTIILVGVGDTVDDLIAEHASVERALEQVLMPRMTPDESVEILRNARKTTGVAFADNAAALIASLAQGLSHYTHALGLYATRAAVDDASWTVREAHVKAATTEAISGSQQSLSRTYHTATNSPRRDALFRQALLACAMANTDRFGYFAAGDVRKPFSRIMKEDSVISRFQQHLTRFAEEEPVVLQRIGSVRRYRYRFANPLLQPFVLMMGLAEGLIEKDDIGAFSDAPQEHSP